MEAEGELWTVKEGAYRNRIPSSSDWGGFFFFCDRIWYIPRYFERPIIVSAFVTDVHPRIKVSVSPLWKEVEVRVRPQPHEVQIIVQNIIPEMNVKKLQI